MTVSYPMVHGVRNDKLLLRFVGLLVFGSIIASAGMYAGSTTAVIGAMLVSPIGGYLINGARALIAYMLADYPNSRVAEHFGPWYNWLMILLLIIITPMAFGAIAGVIHSSSDEEVNSEMKGRAEDLMENKTRNFLISAIVAMAGAALFAWAGVTPMVGVGIATALLPPLVSAGMRLAREENKEAGYSLALFSINAVAIFVISLLVIVVRSKAFRYAIKARSTSSGGPMDRWIPTLPTSEDTASLYSQDSALSKISEV